MDVNENKNYIKENIWTYSSFFTIFREGELQHRGDKEGQSTFGVVDLSAALAEPACLCLVSHLIEATILSCHKDTTFICRGDGQDVGVVCGD